MRIVKILFGLFVIGFWAYQLWAVYAMVAFVRAQLLAALAGAQ